MSKRVVIQNGKVIFLTRLKENLSIICEQGKRRRSYLREVQLKEGDKLIDAKGDYVSPGFIDIHTHGGGGHDFMDGTVEAYLGAAETHAKHGTTALLPTTLTSTTEELIQTFATFKEAVKQNREGARFIGLHLEGLPIV